MPDKIGLEITRLADALDCFWNAALGSARNSQDATATAVAGALAEGFSAIANRLREDQPGSFQARVAPWMQECFGPEISADKLERGDRFIEEALELLQSGDYPRERVAALVNYVYDRPKGEPSQEAGGVMVTLAAYCLAHELDMHEAGEIELARILQPEIVIKIRAKQVLKAAAIGTSPLPMPPDYPVCHADCAGANPPVMNCPLHDA